MDQSIDWREGVASGKSKGEIYLHPEIRRILLEDELDVAMFM